MRIPAFAAALAAATGSVCAQESADTIAARQLIFGREHVDPTGALPDDKVIFSWLSASAFGAAVEGRVIMLDSYATRLEVEPGRTPFVIADLVALNPEAILIGHGHGDHADNAAYIAAKTGATIYATEETCGVMQTDFDRMAADPLIQEHPERAFPAGASVSCVPVTSAGSTPGTEVLNLPVLEPQACVTAFRHLHSVSVDPDPSFPPTPVEIIVDERDEYLFPAGTDLWPNPRQIPHDEVEPVEGQFNTQTTPSAPGGAESVFYSFILRDGTNFSFVWHNTAGALKEGKGNGWDGTPEDGQRIIGLLDALRPVDVQLGTAATGNFTNNGLRDLIMYQDAMEPGIFIPNHITTGSQAREGSSASVYAGYLKQLDLMQMPVEERPQIRWLVDPMDYLKPIVFDVDNPAWSDPVKEAALAGYCAPSGSDGTAEVALD
jgi:hypothetical protein